MAQPLSSLYTFQLSSTQSRIDNHMDPAMTEFDPYATQNGIDNGVSPKTPPTPSPYSAPHSGKVAGAVSSTWHPLSMFIIIIWFLLIVLLLILLERSVAISPTTLHLPWYYNSTGLPSDLLTVFAQGHVPITIMHLSRLVASGVQSSATAPRTWLEFFWTVDKRWSGPLGILAIIWGTARLRVRVSLTTVSFSVISLVALVTPLVLIHAYPIRTIDVQLSQTFNPNTLSAFNMGSIDAYTQAAQGGAGWATNLTVLDLFNTTTFTPVGAERGPGSNDFFFAGDVEGLDTVLPGIRIQGGCQAVNGQTGLGDYSTFLDFCQDHLSTINNAQNLTIAPAPNGPNLSILYCKLNLFRPYYLPFLHLIIPLVPKHTK